MFSTASTPDSSNVKTDSFFDICQKRAPSNTSDDSAVPASGHSVSSNEREKARAYKTSAERRKSSQSISGSKPKRFSFRWKNKKEETVSRRNSKEQVNAYIT